jgi:hypothetical protein
MVFCDVMLNNLTCSSKSLVPNQQTTLQCISEDNNFHVHHHENLSHELHLFCTIKKLQSGGAQVLT